MELQKIIAPREKRVIVYTILHGDIVNQIQKKEHSVDFKENPTKIQEKKIECISLTTNKENLYSFIYVHAIGEIETEINEERPRYPFMKNSTILYNV